MASMVGEDEESSKLQTVLRGAKVADASKLATLRYAFRASTGIATEAEPEFHQRCAEWMAEHLKDGSSWQCWVAERDHELIACLWIQLVEKIPNPRAEPEQHAYLTNFYVQESARGSGIGSQLLFVAITWCKARDVHAVILWPTERSRSLYARHGFAVHDDLMELMIADGSI